MPIPSQSVWPEPALQVWNLHFINSLLLGDAIWWLRSGSILAQVMTWCLLVPSHYLNQYWAVIKGVLTLLNLGPHPVGPMSQGGHQCWDSCHVSRCISYQNLNPLRAKFFRGNIKHIFIFHVTPLHWYDTGGWDPSSNKPRTYPFYIVNIMAAGVLATQGARASAAMILT